MTLPSAFPVATLTSNARAVSGTQTGATNYLTAATPFGQVYGSSQNQGYVNLRPAADNASSPSITTYTFATPTPPAGWGFVLGDLDADQVRVNATGPGGAPVAVADLGFQGVFNYCNIPSPRPGACSGVVAPFDLPSWDPATGILRGNAAALDTVGASGWFQPTAALSTLTFTFTRREGFPVYQTWFATLTRAVSGTVTVDGATPLPGVQLDIFGPGGEVAGTVTTGADGTYSLDGLAPGDYTVRAATPAGYQPVGPSERDADLLSSDVTDVDFDLTLITYPASGTVTADGAPVIGATVTCLDPAGAPVGTALTDSSGSYSCPPVPPGTGYSVVLTVPVGYTADGPVLQTFDVIDAAVAGLDFSLTVPPPVTTTSTTSSTDTTSTGTSTPDTTATDTTATDTTDTTATTTPDTTQTDTTTPDTTATDTTDTTATDTTATTTPDTVTTSTTTNSIQTVTVVTSTVATDTSELFVTVRAYDTQQVGESGLASTGSPVESLLPVGAALLLGGGLLMLFARPRRGAHR